MLKTGRGRDTRRILVVRDDAWMFKAAHAGPGHFPWLALAETMIFTVGTAAYGYDNPGDKLLKRCATESGAYPSFPLRFAPAPTWSQGTLPISRSATSQNKGLGAGTGGLSSND